MIIFDAVLRFTDAVYFVFTAIAAWILGCFLLSKAIVPGQNNQHIYIIPVRGTGCGHSSFYLYDTNK
jgi:hypothetical protein